MKYYKLIFLLMFFCTSTCKENLKNNELKQEKQQVSIYTIGDSTMANKPNPEENPERGWCQLLPQFLKTNIKVKNYAVNGRSTRSFITEGRWDSVYKQLKKGDYVFIQFGHNDQKVNDPKRYTNSQTAYRNNLIKFVKDTKQKEANPVLFTSIVRRKFNDMGVLIDTHKSYPLQVRLVAQELNVPVIDLQYLTEQLEESYGIEESKKLHLHFKPNEIPYYPEGKIDDTHLSLLGATEVSRLAIQAIKEKIDAFNSFVR